MRCSRPKKGIFLPSEFLSEIEALGMHNEFANYILAKACEASARWFTVYQRRTAIAVNVTRVMNSKLNDKT